MAPASKRNPRRKITRDEAKGGKGVKGKRKGGKGKGPSIGNRKRREGKFKSVR